MSIYHHNELFSPFAVNPSPSHQGISTNKSKNQPSSSLYFLDTELLLLLMFMMNNVLLFVVTIEPSHVTLYQVRSQCRGQGGHGPHFNFWTKQGPTDSVSNIRDIVIYGCSEIIRTRNFMILIVYGAIFRRFTAAFYFLSS